MVAVRKRKVNDPFAFDTNGRRYVGKIDIGMITAGTGPSAVVGLSGGKAGSQDGGERGGSKAVAE